MLLQAAFSHLDLALVNIAEQAKYHELSADQNSHLVSIVTTLQRLASQRGKTIVDLDSTDFPDFLGSATFDVRVSKDETLRVTDQDLTEGADTNEVQEAPERMKSSCTSFDKSVQEEAPNSDSEVQPSRRLEATDMLETMIMAYRELCRERDTFAVEWKTLQVLSINLGLRGSIVHSVFHNLGKPFDGVLFEEEWKSLAEEMLSLHKPEEILEMLKGVRRRKLKGQALTANFSRAKNLRAHVQQRLTLSCKSQTRVSWDMFILALLIYVAIALPLTFAFDDLHVIQSIDQAIDWIFLCDVILNFRTTYVNEQHEEEWDWKAIAIRYIRSWFVLDFISSFPLEQLSNGVLPRLQSAKLLKFGKLLKASKVFRLGKLAKMRAGSEALERLEEFIWSKHLNLISQGCMVMIQLMIAGHWSACLLLACDGGVVDEYLGHKDDGVQEYMVALYWAITTMTTVGYGDVTMQSDGERLYAIIAMMVGGTFYGYIVGVVTTILAHRDADHRLFKERMNAVAHWLNHHQELPSSLRRRVWRHFKEALTVTQAVEDSMVLNDLPPELRQDVSDSILRDSVRHNRYFQKVSLRAITALVGTMTEVKFLANEVIVSEGDAAVGMFVVDRGFLHIEKDGNTEHLTRGDSFGMEVLLREVKVYAYTARTRSKVRLCKILRDDFIVIFKDNHEDLMIILDNYYRAEGGEAPDVAKRRPGAASLIRSTKSGHPQDFSDVVLEHLNHLVAGKGVMSTSPGID